MNEFLHNTKRDHLIKALSELAELHPVVLRTQLANYLERAFEAGVHAHSDVAEMERKRAMEKVVMAFETMQEAKNVIGFPS